MTEWKPPSAEEDWAIIWETTEALERRKSQWPKEWTEAAKAWRAERDRDDPISRKANDLGRPPDRCETCDPGPCRFPTFCALSERVNEWWATIPDDHPLREGPLGNLPKGWRHMGEAELWHRLQRAYEARRLKARGDE